LPSVSKTTTMKHCYLTLFIFLFSALYCSTSAQEYLPWENGFATQEEQDAWTEYRLGATEFFNWGIATIGSGYATHDYPVGASATDTTSDWLVSPEIYFHSSAELDLSVRIFTMIGVTAEDHFEIWMSTGSKDPADGDSNL